MMKMNKIILVVIFFTQVSVFFLVSCSKEDDDEKNLQKLSIEEGMDFYYYCNVDIARPESLDQYKNLLVFTAGNGLDADYHFAVANDAINEAGLSSSTVIVSPQFELSNTRNNYYWGNFVWKDGRKSINAVPKISSFSILDSLVINNVLKNYPNIETVLISGHSAGAQYVYRYSALSSLPEIISQNVMYLPLNPTSYTYMGNERWNKKYQRFEVPLNAPSCPGYDEWQYGLKNLSSNEYKRDIDTTEVRSTFPFRNLTIGIGTEDLGGGFDCERLYQGEHRYERAQNVMKYLNEFYPSHNHDIIEVEGVNHEAGAMITSPEIVAFLREVLE